MKTFRAAEWDSDAAGDDTCRELFKGKRKKKSKVNYREMKNKSHSKDLKYVLKKIKRLESSGTLSGKSDIQNLFKRDKHSQEKTKLIPSNGRKSKNVPVEASHKKKRKHPRNGERTEYEDNNKSKRSKKEPKKPVETIILEDSEEDRRAQMQDDLKKKQDLLRKIIELKKIGTKKLKNVENDKKSHLDNHPKKIEMPQVSLPHAQSSTNKIDIDSLEIRRKKMMLEKLKTVLQNQQKPTIKPTVSLREKMMEKLKAARFRFLNEQIYTTTSKEAQNIFRSDPEAFMAYHEGYQQQVRSWPLNPLDVVIKSVRKMPKHFIVADFGCGDAKLSKSVEQKVHSFDLVAVDDTVTACDMSKVPLKDDSIDVAVFCLSLMGTNLHDYLLEANRVLKVGGVLKIAEVESRFQNVDDFIEGVQRFGFKNIWKDFSRDLFYFIDFTKRATVKNRKKLPTMSLLPCLYKKR